MTMYLNSVDGSATSPYNTWAKGATSIQSFTGGDAPTVGETIYVASDHVEAGTATWSIDFANGTNEDPVKIISVNRTTNVVEAGATFNATTAGADINLNGGGFWKGCTFSPNDNVSLGNVIGNANDLQEFEDCTFTCDQFVITYNASSVWRQFRGCTFTLTQNIYGFYGRGKYSFIDCDFTWGTAGLLFPVTNENTALCEFLFDSCKLVDEAIIIDTAASWPRTARFLFRHCQLHASYNAFDGTPDFGCKCHFENCSVGTSAITVPPLGLTYDEGYLGTVTGVSTEYRTGGASDGDTPYSWKVVANGNVIANYRALVTQEVAVWVPETATKLTMYVNGPSGLTDDEVWVEVLSPNESNPNETGQYVFRTTRYLAEGQDLDNAAAALTASSGWDTGTPGTNDYKIDVTIAPDEDGWARVKFFVAINATIFIDPFIEVT